MILHTSCLVRTVAAISVFIVPLPPAHPAPPVPRTVETSGLELVTPKAQQAIDAGLEYLAGRQFDDGGFGSGRQYEKNVAVTGLCGMAFLAAGHTPGRGKYGATVTKAIEYIRDRAQPNGYIVEADVKYYGPMYGHGFATLFLAEAYGTSSDKQLRREIRETLGSAVKLIVRVQNDDGGWRYIPGTTESDISVTVAQVMALRAAHNAGISVPKSAIDKAVKYIQGCQNRDGGFAYQLKQRRESLFPRSAAAVVGLHSAGVYKGPEITRALDYLTRYLPEEQAPRVDQWYYYGHYYAVQAMWHAGGRYWFAWYPAVRDQLLEYQQRDGSWNHQVAHPHVNPEYATAMACLVLQTPNNYLPIFLR